ncbi:T9SS type A sorting domain-containing protein [Hymenobacter antarcticus]|uniref:Por secretion system C-terminal sorting domain-containing protein n=1 Tax=Hymenobacter antarcticus TaxID=486270 RepID=A0ABP7PJI1_9BACT
MKFRLLHLITAAFFLLTPTLLFGNLANNGALAGNGTWQLQGLARTPQRLGDTGPLTFSKLTIQIDSADVALDAPLTVRDTLNLLRGRLALGAFNLNLGRARVLGGSAASYVLTQNPPGPAGTCRRDHVAGPVLYPVGTASGYAPLTYTGQPGGYVATGVRVFEGLLTDGLSGAPFAPAARFVNRTWVATATAAPNPQPGQLAVQWEQTAENGSFQRAQSALYQHYFFSAGPWSRVSAAVAAAGAGPFEAGFGTVGFEGAFAVGNVTALSTRALSGPALLEISPNPSAASVRLSRTGPAGPLTLGLTSLLGQTLLAETTGSLAMTEARLNAALAQAAPGVYVVTVRANGQTQHLRLVRE